MTSEVEDHQGQHVTSILDNREERLRLLSQFCSSNATQHGQSSRNVLYNNKFKLDSYFEQFFHQRLFVVAVLMFNSGEIFVLTHFSRVNKTRFSAGMFNLLCLVRAAMSKNEYWSGINVAEER